MSGSAVANRPYKSIVKEEKKSMSYSAVYQEETMGLKNAKRVLAGSVDLPYSNHFIGYLLDTTLRIAAAHVPAP